MMNASTPILVAAAWIPVQALSEERPMCTLVASIPRVEGVLFWGAQYSPVGKEP